MGGANGGGDGGSEGGGEGQGGDGGRGREGRTAETASGRVDWRGSGSGSAAMERGSESEGESVSSATSPGQISICFIRLARRRISICLVHRTGLCATYSTRLVRPDAVSVLCRLDWLGTQIWFRDRPVLVLLCSLILRCNTHMQRMPCHAVPLNRDSHMTADPERGIDPELCVADEYVVAPQLGRASASLGLWVIAPPDMTCTAKTGSQGGHMPAAAVPASH